MATAGKNRRLGKVYANDRTLERAHSSETSSKESHEAGLNKEKKFEPTYLMQRPHYT
jgi:hypothetical protein